MTGKLDIDLGEDYAFDPRRAKAVAEGKTAVTVDATSLLPDPTTIGNFVSVTWTANGTIADGFIFESAGESREAALAALAAGAPQVASCRSASSTATTITINAADGYIIEGVTVGEAAP